MSFISWILVSDDISAKNKPRRLTGMVSKLMLIAAAATKIFEAEECKSPENLKLFKLKWYLDSWQEMKTTSLKNRIYDGHSAKFKMNWPKKRKLAFWFIFKTITSGKKKKNMVSIEKTKNIKFILFFSPSFLSFHY